MSPPSGGGLRVYLVFYVGFFGLSQMGAVVRLEPVALCQPGAALPAAPLIGYQREGVWSDQVPADGAQTRWPIASCNVCSFHAVLI